MINIDIFSNSEYLVKYKKQDYCLCEHNFISISTQDFNKYQLEFYPQNNTQSCLPFILTFFTKNNNVLCFNSNVTLYKFSYGFELHISDIIINHSTNCICKTLEIDKKHVQVKFDNKKIQIETEDYFRTIFLPLITCEIVQIEKSFYITAETNNGMYLICYSPTHNDLYKYNYDQLEITNKQLKVLEKCNNTVATQKLAILSFKEDKIETSFEYYSSNKELNTMNPNAIPYMFFDAIKSGNLKLAHSLLSENLSNSITTDMFKDFFGEFEKIYFKTLNPLICNIYNKNTAKSYKIEMLEHKINDIIEIN